MIVQTESATEPRYLPTPEEIAERRLAIQAGWSRRERRKRAGGLVSPRWTAPIHPDSTFSEQMDRRTQ